MAQWRACKSKISNIPFAFRTVGSNPTDQTDFDLSFSYLFYFYDNYICKTHKQGQPHKTGPIPTTGPIHKWA